MPKVIYLQSASADFFIFYPLFIISLTLLSASGLFVSTLFAERKKIKKIFKTAEIQLSQRNIALILTLCKRMRPAD